MPAFCCKSASAAAVLSFQAKTMAADAASSSAANPMITPRQPSSGSSSTMAANQPSSRGSRNTARWGATCWTTGKAKIQAVPRPPIANHTTTSTATRRKLVQ